MNNIPFDDTVIKKLVKEFGTPVYLYDEKGMLETSRKLNDMFSWIAEVSELLR
jgi:diaminopimelate decarboxylase